MSVCWCPLSCPMTPSTCGLPVCKPMACVVYFCFTFTTKLDFVDSSWGVSWQFGWKHIKIISKKMLLKYLKRYWFVLTWQCGDTRESVSGADLAVVPLHTAAGWRSTVQRLLETQLPPLVPKHTLVIRAMISFPYSIRKSTKGIVSPFQESTALMMVRGRGQRGRDKRGDHTRQSGSGLAGDCKGKRVCLHTYMYVWIRACTHTCASMYMGSK